MIVEMAMRRIEVPHMATRMAERSSNREGVAWEGIWDAAITMVSTMAEVDFKVGHHQ
jgi:hypothetical protein